MIIAKINFLFWIFIPTMCFCQDAHNVISFKIGTPEEVGFQENTFSNLTDSIDSWINSQKLIGAELLVIKDDKIILHTANGWNDKEHGLPLNKNSIYRIRSQTKAFTGVSILQLQEKGKLNIHDPVSKYLESFKNKRSKDIRISQLLSHSAGFDGTASRLEKNKYEYESLLDYVNDLGNMGPQSNVGVFHYSDEVADIAGAIIEQISGKSLAEYFQENIIDPLSLNDTYTLFDINGPYRDRTNSTYGYRPDKCQFEKYWDKSTVPRDWLHGSGGLFSTTLDYAKFLRIIMAGGTLNGVSILNKESVDLLLTTYGTGVKGSYGYLMQTFNAPKSKTNLMFGHGGSDGTLSLAFPQLNTIVCYFTQSRGFDHRDDFLNILKSIPEFKSYIEDSPNLIEKQNIISDYYVASTSNKLILDTTFLGEYTGGNFLFKENGMLKIELSPKLNIQKFELYALSENELIGKMPHCSDTYIKLKLLDQGEKIVAEVKVYPSIEFKMQKIK